MDFSKETENLINNVIALQKDNKISDTRMCRILHTSPKSFKIIKQGELPDSFRIVQIYYMHDYFGVDKASLFKEHYIIEKK